MEAPLKPKTEEPQDEPLEYVDPSHNTQLLSQLYKMQKRGQFCDAKLIVGDHETCIHRGVLASASSYFFKLFEGSDEENKKQDTFKMKDLKWETFIYLLNFIYTGSLTVPGSQVKSVYRMSQDLRIHSATAACAQHLKTCLTADNCLGIRCFAGDEDLRDEVNLFISENIREVTNSKKFYGLSKVSLEIVVPDEHAVNRASNDQILPQVLVWLKNKMASCKNNLETLSEDVILLYLNTDNTLTDCNEVENASVQDNELVQDYKKLTRKKQSGKKSNDSAIQESPGTMNYFRFDIQPGKKQEMEWSIVASYKTKDNSYMAIAMLNSHLVTISIHYRPASVSLEDDPDLPVDRNSNGIVNIKPDIVPLQGMTTNRCAFGIKAIDGKLFVCGGYERGECLRSSEVYDFENNQWTKDADMKSARGRFDIDVYAGKIYACGGSNGNDDVRTVECYDFALKKWKVVAEASRGKASPGIVVLQGKLYVLGGCVGQTTVSSCEVLDLETFEWTNIPPLHIQRYQVAATVLRNKIYAIGGTNGWKCLSEVEVYDPATNEWSMHSNMNIARRGAGVDVFNGKIYVVGGNDGQMALNSIEIYDPETHSWSLGPSLSVHRANCGVVVLKNKLFAIGGFSGKKFLNSLEYLDLDMKHGWCCHMPTLCSPTLYDFERQISESGSGNGECSESDVFVSKNGEVSGRCGNVSGGFGDVITNGVHKKCDVMNDGLVEMISGTQDSCNESLVKMLGNVCNGGTQPAEIKLNANKYS